MKKVTVRVPGSCGELLQGTRNGVPLLVTCPIDRYSQVVIQKGNPTELPPKSEQMAKLASDFYGVSLEGLRIDLSTELPIGKGMSSSSADIGAIGAAIACWGGKEPEPVELLNLCQRIEPTDGIFFEGLLCLDHIYGSYLYPMATPPAMQVQIFDCGGQVNTIDFNGRPDLKELNRAKEPMIQKALEELEEALKIEDKKKLAKASTLSAIAHQQILKKPHLEEIIASLSQWGALGLTVAHSGTVIGLLWDEDTTQEQMDKTKELLIQKWSEYQYWGEANLIGGGIQIQVEGS